MILLLGIEAIPGTLGTEGIFGGLFGTTGTTGLFTNGTD